MPSNARSPGLKRKSCDQEPPYQSNLTRWAKRQRTEPAQFALRRQIRPLHKKPEPGSLNDLLRERHRERLYLRPIAWTQAQLGLLDAAFEKTRPPKKKSSTKPRNKPECTRKGAFEMENSSVAETCWKPVWGHERWLRAMQWLGSLDPSVQSAGLEESMSMLGLRRPAFASRPKRIQECLQSSGIGSKSSRRGANECADSLVLQYGDVAACKVSTGGFFETAFRSLCVAYVNFGSIESLREQYVWNLNRLEREVDPIIWERGKKALRSITPPNRCEDPYILSVLLALAQEQTARRACENDVTHTVYLIGLPWRRARMLYVYKADVSKEFLQKLQEPSRCSRCDRLVVQYYAVRIGEPEKTAQHVWRILQDELAD